MQLAVIAGGLGTRLRPLTESRPKALVPLLNRPQILHVIDHRPHPCDEVLVAVNFRYEDVRGYFERHAVGVKVTVVDEPNPLGTGGAIKNLEPHLDGRFAVANGDVIDSIDFDAFVGFHEQMRGIASLAVWPVADPSAFGVVDLEGTRVVRFVEKPAKGRAPSDLVNAGRYIFEPEVLDAIDAGRAVSLEREVFPRLVPRGLHAFRYEGFWSDAGTLPRYLLAQRQLLDAGHGGVSADAETARGRIEPPVLIGPGSFVEGHVGPHVVLGRGCRVGRSTIRDAVLFDGAAVDDKAEIEGSMLGVGVAVGEGAVVRHSIVGDGMQVPPHARILEAKVAP